MFDKLRSNQPPFSIIEIIMVFIAADIPRYVGEGIAMHFGLSEWPAMALGFIVMIACMFGYFAVRRVVLSD